MSPPPHTIQSFLTAIAEDEGEFLDGVLSERPLKILDPCAGGDEYHEMAYPMALRKSPFKIGQIDTIDIREDSKAEMKTDFLTADVPDDYNLIITNPPFNIAMDVIKRSLEKAADHTGVVVMLLRLNFFGTRQRQKFWQENMPILTYVHTRRPSFLNTWGTDSIEYMHAVWRVGLPAKFTLLRIID